LLKIKRIFIFFIQLFICFNLSWAQTTDRQLFQKGLDFYQQEDFYNCRNTFLQLLKDFPQSHLLTATKLMLAKSYYRMSDYKAAKILCDHFENQHESSAYVDDVIFLRGKILFRENQYFQAVEEWLKVINGQGDPRLKKKTGNYAFFTMNDFLSSRELNRIRQNYHQEPLSGLLEILLANKLIQSGERERGLEQLELFLSEYPNHLYADLARKIVIGKDTIPVGDNSFLVLKSGREDMGEVSDGICQGIYYAAYEMNSRFPDKRIKVDSLSFSGNLLATLQTALKTVQQKKPLVVVGAVDNDETALLAQMSKYEDLPCIAPLSSENGLTEIGEDIFQINPDAEIKGKTLAEYAINQMGAETFAILAPADDYGQSIVNSFERTVLNYGGEIAEKQWYYKNTQDFSRQFKAIRDKGFYLTFRDSILSEDPERNEEIIQEEFSKYKNETLFSNENVRGSIDSTQIPSTGIDAIFIALYPEDLSYIPPQFAYNNIQATILGNEGWNDPDQLQLHQPYLDGLIFITSGYFDPQSMNYREFQSRFRQKMQVTPTFYHFLGYDIGKWLMMNYQPGMVRESFTEKLENGDPYKGIITNINFGEKPRVNDQLNLVRYYLGQYLKLK
jgi:ABC-type branched-subunit amino acid transport system substrate-binding protein/outer membrane protein assembly factor BamD (BamD/ComL family)